MKKRCIVAACVLLLFALFVIPVLALDLHALLSRDMSLFSLSPLIGWTAIMQIPQVRKMYFLLLMALMLGLIWILATGSNLQYRSNMQQVTPDIQTPCAAGQGQYGTARWMKKSSIPRHFTTVQLSQINNIDELLRAGRQEKEDIHAESKTNTGRRSGAGLDS